MEKGIIFLKVIAWIIIVISTIRFIFVIWHNAKRESDPFYALKTKSATGNPIVFVLFLASIAALIIF